MTSNLNDLDFDYFDSSLNLEGLDNNFKFNDKNNIEKIDFIKDSVENIENEINDNDILLENNQILFENLNDTDTIHENIKNKVNEEKNNIFDKLKESNCLFDTNLSNIDHKKVNEEISKSLFNISEKDKCAINLKKNVFLELISDKLKNSSYKKIVDKIFEGSPTLKDNSAYMFYIMQTIVSCNMDTDLIGVMYQFFAVFSSTLISFGHGFVSKFLRKFYMMDLNHKKDGLSINKCIKNSFDYFEKNKDDIFLKTLLRKYNNISNNENNMKNINSPIYDIFYSQSQPLIDYLKQICSFISESPVSLFENINKYLEQSDNEDEINYTSNDISNEKKVLLKRKSSNEILNSKKIKNFQME